MQLIQQERQNEFSSPPRRHTEEWHEQQLRADDGTVFIDDRWFYHWTGREHPPAPFRHHETQFRQCTPSDISKNGWAVLTLAMGELSGVFNIRVKQGDLKSRLGQRPTYKLEWVMLNRYWRCPCILGIYGDQYVVAATSVSQQRSPFVPFNQYRIIQQNPQWKNLKYRAGYRHFQAQFDIGYSFFTGLKHLPCVVSYGVDVGVHGDVKAWAQINDCVFVSHPKMPAIDRLSSPP